MAKIPQRNVNLANRAVSLAGRLLRLSEDLTGSAKVDGAELKEVEDRLLDTIGYIREYRRKVTPIEVKGQRG